MDELTDDEKQLLAREVAADNHRMVSLPSEVVCPDCDERFENYVSVAEARHHFTAGWDAAIEYINAKKLQQSTDAN